jgi:uncharacterized protein
VLVGTDLDVSGRAAQLGRGMMQSVADQLMRDFSRRLERDLAGREDGAAAEEVATAAAPSGKRETLDAAPASAPDAPPRGVAGDREEDALDLGSLVPGVLGGRQRSLALGALALAVLTAIVGRRRRPAALVVSFRSGRRGRRVDVRLGR